MTLAIGSRLGTFEITGTLGAGGMGEVYRARDSRLGRDVALKLLPEPFASDADRLARFEREAQVLASLNHPNVAAIHGLEDGPGTADSHVRALVLELVEGPTLADRMAHGPFELAEALPIARQIAEALEAAHSQGIVHRDLKPANIKVRPDGLVKVLDFGLAKALDSVPVPPESSLSPTMASPAMTRVGVILGTAAYMSPEQARGFAADSRADIWAFGVVLFEMFARGTLFDGPTVSDTIASVLRAEIDWARLPPDLPRGMRTLIARCLQRDRRRRLQHIGDARIEIDDLQSHPHERPAAATASSRWKLAIVSGAIAAAVVGPIAWLLKPSSPAPAPAPTRFVVRTPYELAGRNMMPFDLSADGRQLVYVASVNGNFRLFHQSLDSFAPQPLESAEGGSRPFMSPKGDVVGFFSSAAGQLRQVRLGGGAATRLIDVEDPIGAAWGEDGTLVLSAAWGRPLKVVRPSTPRADELTRMKIADGERGHIWPQVLPGGRAVLFTIWKGAPTWDEADLAIADLSTGEHVVVMRGASFGRYAASGHLLFWRANAIHAVPFDFDARTVRGEPVRVVPDVRLDNFTGGAHFAVSTSGTLAYIPGGLDTFTETFVADGSGRILARLDDSAPSGDPAFSPDGSKVAATLYSGGTFGMGIYDLKRRLLVRLPVTGDNGNVAWSPTGDRVMFLSNTSGEYQHYWLASDGSGKPEILFPGAQQFTSSQSEWSADGRHFVFVKSSPKTGSDIWMHTPGAAATPVALVAGPANESNPTLSPDGRFMAYQADETGTIELYVRPFPNVEGRRELISRGGGRGAKWSRDGTAIFYTTDNGIMRVPVATTGTSLSFGEPSMALPLIGLVSFDVSPDGRAFAIERTPTEKAATDINIVLNWFEELKRLVPRN